MDYRVAMLPPRVTMKAVARAAGAHQTTVSLALRNNPRLPEKTRRRIQKIADRLGYRPDPMLAALSHYRFGRREVKAPTTLAFLLNFRDQAELKASHPHWLFLEGARRQAERIGYQLEIFYIGHRTAGAGQRIAAVLQARGIVGDIKGVAVVASPVYKQHFSLKSGHCLEDDGARNRPPGIRRSLGPAGSEREFEQLAEGCRTMCAREPGLHEERLAAQREVRRQSKLTRALGADPLHQRLLRRQQVG